MSKNQNKPQTVITAQSTIDLASMSPAELLRYAAAQMTAGDAIKSLDEVKSGRITEVTAEIASLRKRNEEIELEIFARTSELRSEKEANLTRLAELNAKEVGRKVTGPRPPCRECGVGAHNVERGEVTTCRTYLGKLEATAKDMKAAEPVRTKAAMHAEIVRTAILNRGINPAT